VKNRELFCQVALVALALAATNWVMQDVLSLKNESIAPITQQLTGIQAAYGTGGQDPTPTPYGDCTWDCSSCDSPAHCTKSENDNNWSSVSLVESGGICFGAAASKNQCCGGIYWDNKGIHFRLITDADVTVWKNSADYDAFCDSWDGWWIDHDDNEDFEDIDARFPHSESVPGVIAFCECPCNGTYVSEHLQPTSSGFLYFCYTTITIEKNGNEDYEFHWDVNPKLSSETSNQLCAAPTWGNDARISIEGAQTDGGTGSMILTDLQPGWTGCARWDGSFYGGGKWDETYLHAALSQNSITNIEASTALDYCYQTTSSDLGGDLLIPACCGGSGCSLGSRGGGPQGLGFSICSPPFQTPINVPFPEPRLLLGWNLGSGLSPFGDYSPLAHHSVFMFVAPDSQAGSYYHLYQGAQSIRTVKKWSDTHFMAPPTCWGL